MIWRRYGGGRTPEVQDGTRGAGRHGFPTVGRRALAHRAGHTAWVTPRKKTKAGVEEKAKGTPNVPSGRRKSPAKAVLVQANIRQVPAHVRWCQRSRGTNRSRKDFRRDISLDGIIKYHH